MIYDAKCSEGLSLAQSCVSNSVTFKLSEQSELSDTFSRIRVLLCAESRLWNCFTERLYSPGIARHSSLLYGFMFHPLGLILVALLPFKVYGADEILLPMVQTLSPEC